MYWSTGIFFLCINIQQSATEGIQQKTHVIFAAINEVSEKKEGWTYGDLTGKYPVQSLHGNNYILVVYHYDANAILATPLKNREKGTILNGYKKLHERLINCGCKPQLQIMDNEVSALLK